ncbi:hypothetical protein ABPG77_001735 [Micractinium sp. CCAP 211/92]
MHPNHKLPDLPYGYDALEPYVDTQTMTLHHTKHHQTYVNNLNTALGKHSEVAGLGIVEVCRQVGGTTFPQDIATAVRNNGGGHWNHSFFWKLMCNPSSTGGPSGELKQAIEAEFGSVQALMEKFDAAAAGECVFGSGWAWLVVGQDGKLSVTSTANQDNPLMSNIVQTTGSPVLGLDVWYQNRRPEYIAAWHKVINWEQANENFQAGKAGGGPKL